jgi:hypothetical protein
MNKIFAIVLMMVVFASAGDIFLADRAEKLHAISVIEVAEIIEGIALGVFKEEGFENLETCLKDAATIGIDVKDAIVDFEKKNTTGILAGIKKIGEAIKLIPSTVTSCKAVPADLKKLEEMASVFTSPISLVYHVGKNLIVNGKDIYNDIDDAITQYKALSYKNFGEDIGEALASVFLQTEKINNIKVESTALVLKDIGEVVLGIFTGVFKQEGLVDIYKCIDGAE